jgi:very-short-patch-repair endonuclease
MRYLKHSTKPERIIHEILKELHIPLKHRWLVSGHEIDFIVDKYAIEVNGHEQNVDKNNMLIGLGYIPVHFYNQDVLNNRNLIKDKIKKYVKSN